jgi:photosystem II stability/assembly factor-like uncharacterized protein
MALDVNNGNRIWVATNVGIYYVGPSGMYGLPAWLNIEAVKSAFYITALLFPPQLPDVALAGGRFGIMRSQDGGATWAESNAGLTGAAISQVVAGTGDLCYAATDQGLFRSRDNGSTWERSIGQEPFFDVDADLLDPQFVYAVGFAPIGSSDAGETWTTIAMGQSVAVPPGDPNIVLVTASARNPFASHLPIQASIAKSIDGGETFTTTFSTTLSASVRYPSAHGQDMAIAPSNPDIVYVALGGTGHRSTDRGTTWQHLDVPAIRFEVSPVNESVVYASSTGALWRTTDGGDNWKSLPIPEPWNVGVSFEGWPSAMAADPECESCLFAGTDKGFLLFSQDFGESWREIGRAPAEVLSLAVERSLRRRLLVGTTAGLFSLEWRVRPRRVPSGARRYPRKRAPTTF